MNVTLPSGDAANALKIAGLAIAAKTALPILKNVLITANSRVIFAATDLNTSIEYFVDGEIGKEGSCCIEADTVSQLVAAMDDSSNLQVIVNSEGTKVALLHGRSVYKVPSLKAEEYPALEMVKDADKKVELEFTLGELKEYIRKTSFAASQDESRPTLTGEYWEVSEEEATIVVTDTHRMAVMSLPPFGCSEQASFIIPVKALNFVRNMSGDDADEVKMSLSENLVSFETSSWRLVNRLISGKYPNFRRIIPGEHSVVWKVPVAPLSAALRRIRVLTRTHKTNADLTVFSGSGDTLELSAIGFDSGEGSEKVDMSGEGEELKLGLNAKYLQDSLSACDDMVEFRMSSPLSPVLLVSGDRWRCVIMPMDLKGI